LQYEELPDCHKLEPDLGVFGWNHDCQLSRDHRKGLRRRNTWRKQVAQELLQGEGQQFGKTERDLTAVTLCGGTCGFD
jgi:hypothetical protein